MFFASANTQNIIITYQVVSKWLQLKLFLAAVVVLYLLYLIILYSVHS